MELGPVYYIGTLPATRGFAGKPCTLTTLEKDAGETEVFHQALYRRRGLCRGTERIVRHIRVHTVHS